MKLGRFQKYVDRHREDLATEHHVGDMGQLVLFIAFIVVWITDAFVFKYSTLLNDCIPFFAVRLWLGIIVLIVSVYMAWNGMVLVFGTVREKPNIIRKGVFGWVRHPIYISEILLYLGLLIFNISLSTAGVWVIGIVFLHYISRYEEKMLLERFGDDYRKYMKDVPMYFPRLFRKTSKAPK